MGDRKITGYLGTLRSNGPTQRAIGNYREELFMFLVALLVLKRGAMRSGL